jgi:shikimate kinase|tara:strand:- start:108 stop:617 length:510 start_codon:yes stop_codon:yes gene_type:complete
MKFNNIFLIGLMGSGKTSIGKILAKNLKKNFLDIDNEIINKMNLTISEIFEKYGEIKFREMESEILHSLTIDKNAVISTGGGIILNKKNISKMKEIGVIVHLDIDIKAQIFRVKNIKNRPLLDGKGLQDKLKKMKIERDKIYKEISDITIITTKKSRSKILTEIENKLS